jgi:predicted RNA-binding Zn-ribbon protein involved in translation (DUF1610 family)
MNKELEKIIEEKDKFLLSAENVIGFSSMICFLSSMFGVASGELSKTLSAVFIVSSTIVLIMGGSFALKIEQKAGYYKCTKCDHAYVPKSYAKVFIAPHLGRTRYMKCESCNHYSWHKKVLTKKK